MRWRTFLVLGLACSFFAVIFLGTVEALAECAMHETAKLLASDGAASDLFGSSVSISGDYAIVGAHRDDDNGSSSGSAYIFKRSEDVNDPNWYQQAKLTASDGAADDYFGYPVSISGDYVIIGAYGNNDYGINSGSAYIFKLSEDINDPNWYEQAKLLASDGATDDYFGRSVSISGDYAIVGALYNNNGTGAAYIFKRVGTNWSLRRKLLASDGGYDDLFGCYVSISGDYAIVGALYGDGSVADSGSAYIFKRNGENWSEQAKILASDGAGGDGFGLSVSISGDYAIVGAPYRDSVYIFKRSHDINDPNWYQQAKLTASDGAADDYFGYPVYISGDYAIVGAHRDDDNGSSSGSAYIFKRSEDVNDPNWYEQAKLLALDGGAGDYFGYSVSISGNYAIAGAEGDDQNGMALQDCGSAYIFYQFIPTSATPSQPDLQPDSDTGVADNDNLTKLDNSNPANALQFEVSNTITDANVTLYVNGIVIGSAVATGPNTVITTDGIYDLNDGSHSITARQTEPNIPESGDSPALIVIVDTIAPVVTVDTLTTCDKTPALTGTVDDNDAVIKVTVDYNTYIAINNGDGTWELPDDTVDPPLSYEAYDMNAVAMDIAGNMDSDEIIDGLIIEEHPLMVYGLAPGSPNDSNTTGGEVVTFVGEGFMSGMSVVFATPVYQVTIDPSYVFANPDGNELTVVVPAFPPGCDCAYQAEINEPILVNVLFETECGQVDLFHSTGDLFQYDIVVELVTNPYGVQADINDANAGTCIVLEIDKNFAGPLLIDSTKSRITLTSQDINDPGRTQIHGEYAGGDPPPDATITFDGCGDGICISGLDFILGNCGAEIRNAAAPIIKSCNFDNNFSDSDRGGGINITTAAHPIIWDSLIAVNNTNGSGGGIRIDNASGIIVDCSVMANTAADSGGGLFLKDTSADLVIAGTNIWINDYEAVPQYGGGVCWTGGTLTDPAMGLLLRNDIWANSASGDGAGVFVDIYVAPIIVENVISENIGLTENSYGGGIYIEEYNRNTFSICGNIISSNEAQRGGALALMKKSEVQVERNLIFCNYAVQNHPYSPWPAHYAAGIYMKDAASQVCHNTIYGNIGAGGSAITPDTQGGGIHGEGLATGAPRFWDNILLDNEGWEIYFDTPLFGNKVDWNLAYDTAEPNAIFSLFTYPGENCIIADPLLNGPVCDPTDPWQAFGLQTGSPGICNASDGCNRGAMLSSPEDCNGCEPVGCLPADGNDCNGNGIPDHVDFLMGTSLDLNWNGHPDECNSIPGDFDRNGSVNFIDFAIFSLAWSTRSGDAQWNPDCDISIPAGYFVNILDLAVFAENWLAGAE